MSDSTKAAPPPAGATLTSQSQASSTRASSHASASLDPDTAAGRALDLAARLVAGAEPDPAATWAAALLADPQVRAEDVAAEIGLSLRQLRRRCHAAVGYGPKTLQRVLRFRRFVSRIDAAQMSRVGQISRTWPSWRPRRATPTRLT